MNRETSIRRKKYSEELLKFGITFIVETGIEKPQCVICNEIMSAESMKPNKIKLHFNAEHPSFTGKDVQYLKNKTDGVKKSRLDFGGKYQQQNMAPLKLNIWWLSESPKPRNLTPLPRSCCCQQPKTLFELCLELTMLAN